MKKYNIAIVLFMNDKAIALECPEYCSIEIMQDLMSWDEDEAKIIWKEIIYNFFILKYIDSFSYLCPYCLYEEVVRMSDDSDCSKCFFGKINGDQNNNCGTESLFAKLVDSNKIDNLTNEFYKDSINKINEMLEIK